MKFLGFIFRIFMKITGFIPFWLMIKPKRFHQNKQNKAKIGLKGAIIMSNHMGMFDYFTLLLMWPFRKIRFIAGEVIYRMKFRGFMSDLMDNIRIDRNHLDLNFADEAVRTLNKNGVVGIYPQGGFKKKGEIGPFKSSIVYIALKSGAPIIPVYQDGHYGIFKRNHVSIGEKIYLRDYCSSENPTKEEILNLTKMLEKKMLELKKQQESYIKYKTYNLFSLRWFILDYTKWTSALVDWWMFPKRFHYVSNDGKKIKIKGKAILAANHNSFIDPILMHFYFRKRRIHIITAEDLYDNMSPFIRWFFNQIGNIKYNRVSQKTVDMKSFMISTAILNTNSVVGIFPEGHIVKDISEMDEFHGGAALLALMSGAPIYPAYFVNVNSFFKMQHVMVGEPIRVSDYFPNGYSVNVENMNLLNNVLREKMELLKKEGAKYKRKEKQK